MGLAAPPAEIEYPRTGCSRIWWTSHSPGRKEGWIAGENFSVRGRQAVAGEVIFEEPTVAVLALTEGLHGIAGAWRAPEVSRWFLPGSSMRLRRESHGLSGRSASPLPLVSELPGGRTTGPRWLHGPGPRLGSSISRGDAAPPLLGRDGISGAFATPVKRNGGFLPAGLICQRRPRSAPTSPRSPVSASPDPALTPAARVGTGQERWHLPQNSRGGSGDKSGAWYHGIGRNQTVAVRNAVDGGDEGSGGWRKEK